jgi:hypothetical protein
MDTAKIREHISQSRVRRVSALLTIKGFSNCRRDSRSKQEHCHDKRLHIFGRFRERVFQASN